MRVARLSALVAAGFSLLIPAVARADCANTDIVPTAANLDQVRAAVLCLHNQDRAAHGLPALHENARLRKSATSHSADMVGEGFFAHTDPDGDTFVDRIEHAGYAKSTQAWTLGENLAWGTGSLSTPDGVENAWMNSPGHRENLLDRAYRDVGIGVKLGTPTDPTVGVTITVDFGDKD